MHLKRPLIPLMDISMHTLLSVKLVDPKMPPYALDITMPQFDVYSYGSNGEPLFLAPMSIFGVEAVKMVQPVTVEQLAKVRKHVDYGGAARKQRRQQHVSAVFTHYVAE